MRDSATQRPQSVETPPRVTAIVACAAFVTAFLLRFTYVYLDDLTRQRSGTLPTRLLEELTGATAALVLFPAIVLLERRHPLDAGRWRTSWPWHVAGLVLYSALHTTLMAVSRWTLFPALGLGPYDYGIMSVRYFMESPNDIIAYAIVLGVLTLLRVQQRLQREQLHASALARDAAEARLEALSLRLQPHFLFNALNTISSTIYTDPVAADVMIGQLGDLLREALRTSDRPEISLAEDVDVLRAYLGLVEARFGDRLVCRLTIDPEAARCAVPAFLLQPLVENAVRHGSASASGGVHVEITAALDSGTLRLAIENDLLDETPRPRRGGTGLSTTADRLRLLYGNAHQFSAAPEQGRFRVHIEIPARIAPLPSSTRADDRSYASTHR